MFEVRELVMSALVNELILENKGTFENKRVNNIYEYGVYGKTIRHKLYASDKKERYFHLYHRRNYSAETNHIWGIRASGCIQKNQQERRYLLNL